MCLPLFVARLRFMLQLCRVDFVLLVCLCLHVGFACDCVCVCRCLFQGLCFMLHVCEYYMCALRCCRWFVCVLVCVVCE